jgi:pilus assembly protein Flp/PilA
VRSALKAFLVDESGATAVEYGLIVAGIFLAILSAVNLFANNANTMYNTISSTVAGATH